MSRSGNIEVQKQLGEAINGRELPDLSKLMSADVIDHDPAPNQGPGPKGFIAFFKELISAFPDLKVDVEHMVADEDNVSIAYTVTGTHRGNFMGVPATGRRIRARGMQISRFEDEKLVERWGSSDQLGILEQIGASIAA